MGKPRAANQGGILQGENPSIYDPKNPIIMFIIQAGIIIIFTRLLHFPLSKLRQPRVIAEVIGGILLGPSVLGHVPNFTDTIFPAASLPTLSMAANVGLILFLFLVGLEVDLRLLVSNWRIALSVGLAGMILPFALGCGIAYGLYHQFRNDSGLQPISFGTYMLFVGVAMAITAFPVLCRILTELNLLQSQVGIVVLSAGVGNDVVGWILLALSVALVNAGSGIVALYVLLTGVGYILFLTYAVRPAFIWLLRRTGSLQAGPTQSVVALTILMVFASAFFTAVIGIHPIFGAFLMGLICPHDGGFAIKLTEKIEDLITVFFLPLYFALSGLSTNIGLLDNGITWAYVIGVIAIAFFAKVTGGTLAARANGLVWRESFTIGALMSCKGLVELIVLNVGLQAKILSQRTFTIFVVMALVTTFVTTPLVSALFPPWYQKKLAAWKRGEIDWDGNSLSRDDGSDTSITEQKSHTSEIRKLLVCLRLDSLPSLFTFVSLLGGEGDSPAVVKTHPSKNGKTESYDQAFEGVMSHKRPLEVHGLRMLELTERLSSVMKESEVDEWSARDPVVNAFHTFGQLNNVAVSGEVQLVPEGSYADMLSTRAHEHRSDMILLPWSETGSALEATALGFSEAAQNTFGNATYNQFVTQFLDLSPCNTAIFVNNGFGAIAREEIRGLARASTSNSQRGIVPMTPKSPHLPTAPLLDRSHHIMLPFSGGPDDRLALHFVLRLAKNPHVTVTIALIASPNDLSEDHPHMTTTTQTTKDNSTIATTEAASQEHSSESETAFFHAARDTLDAAISDRVLFTTLETPSPTQQTSPAQQMVDFVHSETGTGRGTRAGDLIVVGRKNNHHHSMSRGQDRMVDEGVQSTLGHGAAALIGEKVRASILVVQAATGLKR